ncbi:hypothetical protein OAA67_00040 [Winogradskyella sp.]|nr:hypothetical protein [Winogradskyella sp.]
MSKKHEVDGMLIGKYVQKTIKTLFNEQKFNKSDLIKLQEQKYCKTNFDLNYPMFNKSREPKARYYANEITKGYYLTNDWYEKHWDSFLKWVNNKTN